MSFSETLNEYLIMLDISYPKFAEYSGMSVSAVRRYRNGESEPSADSEQFRRLADGICRLAEERGLTLTADEIRAELRGSLKNSLGIDFENYIANVNALMKTLDIRVTVLARALSFDASHISKILSGQRRPGRIAEFTQGIGAFVSRSYTDEQHRRSLARLIGCDEKELSAPKEVSAAVVRWLGSNTVLEESNPVGNFLDKLESFHLEEFINSIRFNDIKLPSVPFQLPTAKSYVTLEGMKKCELDFIKATVLSRSGRDIICYSDMPLEEMAKDEDFAKKWMFGTAMMLKKGLRLHMIHNVHRPFHEMMLGLESNIPMYMTGQISPYYLPTATDRIFTHIIKVSGAAALEGYAIAGHQSEGKYVLSKSDEDIRFVRAKAERLLQKAKPLMEIYRSDRKAAYRAAMERSWQQGDRLTVSAALPVFTLSKEALSAILTRNRVRDAEAREIEAFREDYLRLVSAFLKENRLTIVVPAPSRAQFDAAPIHLALSEMFCETDVPYTYAEYAAHLQATKDFSVLFPNLTVNTDPAPAFRHISYSVLDTGAVIVSKNKSPTIHFVIHHKKMVQAFKSFR